MAGKSKAKNPVVIGAIIVSALALVGLGAYARFVPNANRIPEEFRRSESNSAQTQRVSDPLPDPSPSQPKPVTVLRPKMVGDDLKFDEAKEAIPPKQNGMVFAVNQFLSGLDAVPKSARLLSAEVKGGIAELNFNEALVAGYGTEDEMIIVEGILRTMAQFEGVDAVQFQVNKAALDTLGGIDLSTPQKVIR